MFMNLGSIRVIVSNMRIVFSVVVARSLDRFVSLNLCCLC